MKEHYESLKGAITTGGQDACDALYNFYLNLNQTIPDIIGKQPEDMTKSQKVRLKAKEKEINNEPNRS